MKNEKSIYMAVSSRDANGDPQEYTEIFIDTDSKRLTVVAQYQFGYDEYKVELPGELDYCEEKGGSKQ